MCTQINSVQVNKQLNAYNSSKLPLQFQLQFSTASFFNPLRDQIRKTKNCALKLTIFYY